MSSKLKEAQASLNKDRCSHRRENLLDVYLEFLFEDLSEKMMTIY